MRERGDTRDPADPLAERARLIAHFDRVLEILSEQDEASIDRAVERLGDPTARDSLVERRSVQIERLRAYRDAARFPRNEDPLARVEPIFVDEHGTACAVGWLMLQDGWGDEVYAIAHRDNGVYVDDVEAGPLLDWVATSGLTREEAALIQPGYSPPVIGTSTFESLLAGGSLIRSGLLYDNFELERVSPTLPLAACLYYVPGDPGCHTPTDPSTIAPLDQIGANGSNLVIQSADGQFMMPSTLSNWLYLGDGGEDGGTDLMGIQAPTCFDCTSYSVVRVRFDVTAIDAGFGISAAALRSIPYLNNNHTQPYDNSPSGNALNTQTSLVIQSAIASDATDLGALVIGERLGDIYDYDPLLQGYEVVSFTPVPRLHVDTTAYLLDDNWLTGFFHEFQLVPVPEPASALLLAAGLIGLGLRRRSRVDGFERIRSARPR